MGECGSKRDKLQGGVNAGLKNCPINNLAAKECTECRDFQQIFIAGSALLFGVMRVV